MADRTVEDRLRQQYFELLPEVQRLTHYVETEVRHCLLPQSIQLDKHEVVTVTSRVKGCTSAIDKLRRAQEGQEFDQGNPDSYSLTALNDLAGVRVQVFPRTNEERTLNVLSQAFPGWATAPFDNMKDAGLKYHGGIPQVSSRVSAEIQVLPRLIGLFWEVEHSAVYKPSTYMRTAVGSFSMRKRTMDVMNALRAFEDEFAKIAAQEPIDDDQT